MAQEPTGVQALEGIPAGAATRRHPAPRSRVRRAVLVLVVVAAVCGSAVACGNGGTPAGGAGGAASREPGSANPPAGTAPPAARDGQPALPAGGAPPGRTMPSPAGPAVPAALTSPEHQRYQQLRVETLRLMIAAAQRALPIGPFQQRIDAAASTALQDVSAAADRMEEIVTELREAIAASDRG